MGCLNPSGGDQRENLNITRQPNTPPTPRIRTGAAAQGDNPNALPGSNGQATLIGTTARALRAGETPPGTMFDYLPAAIQSRIGTFLTEPADIDAVRVVSRHLNISTRLPNPGDYLHSENEASQLKQQLIDRTQALIDRARRLRLSTQQKLPFHTAMSLLQKASFSSSFMALLTLKQHLDLLDQEYPAP